MGAAAERLTSLVGSKDRYDIPYSELRAAQIEAMNERLQERKGAIKLLGHRAKEAELTEVRSHEEVVPLLLPHTAYKSYPESWLAQKRWDRLSQMAGHRLHLSRGAGGKLSDAMTWTAGSRSSRRAGIIRVLLERHDRQVRHARRLPERTWNGAGRRRSPRIRGDRASSPRGTGACSAWRPIAHVPRNLATGEAYTAALQDPKFRAFHLSRAAHHRRRAHADGRAAQGDCGRHGQTRRHPGV